jgi:hypothetical protein
MPFRYTWSFVAQGYGKFAGNLLPLRLRVLGVETTGLLETKKPRKYAVEFPGPRYDHGAIEIALPAGFEVLLPPVWTLALVATTARPWPRVMYFATPAPLKSNS